MEQMFWNDHGFGSAPRARGTRPFTRYLLDYDRISPACAGNTRTRGTSAVDRPDQPRVRGEHHNREIATATDTGSAPRARGTRQRREGVPGDRRISPACAGNTPRSPTRCSTGTDQPRVRGEHPCGGMFGSSTYGSAPRARGTLCRMQAARLRRWISPACAGNTSPTSARSGPRTDQPRVRGEHAKHALADDVATGSAPRARGTPAASSAGDNTLRISPACAGNTFGTDLGRSIEADQPRVRGEHRTRSWAALTSSGSAPRARGTRLPQLAHLASDLRISPACAGNTSPGTPPTASPTDQPRVRGEHSGIAQGPLMGPGSAPRARGTLCKAVLPDTPTRISPACAGNTARYRRHPSGQADQPRVRGEHITRHAHRPYDDGSAPRARGTPHVHPAATHVHRISPACAGNT